MACSHQLAGSALAGLQKAFVSECGVRVLSLASSSRTVVDVRIGQKEPCWGEPSGRDGKQAASFTRGPQ